MEPVSGRSATAASAPRPEATFRNDAWMAPFYGVLEAGWTSFALVVAIRFFGAPEGIKAFIAGAMPMGFLLAPLSLYAAARAGMRPNRACVAAFGLSALAMLGGALAPNLAFFAVLVILAQVAAAQHAPPKLQVYAENYTSDERGKRVTRPLILIASAAIAFSLYGGWLLDADIGLYRGLFLAMAAAAAACAWFCGHYPCSPLSRDSVGNPWQNISLIWKDRLFGWLLSSWMLLGFGNLITLPIRVEYLANPAYGINAENRAIAFLLLVVPSTCRILSTRVWGRFFDRFNLVLTRNALNACLMTGILLFFFSRHIALLTLAMVFVGLAMGGGKIMWTLWVTRIAPPDQASSYMSVHMAMTGLRGSVAPFAGYAILAAGAPATVGLVGAGLIVLSIAMFFAVLRHPRIVR